MMAKEVSPWRHQQVRAHAAALAVQAFAHEVEGARTGSRLLSFIILLERYLLDGGDAAAEAMGWEIKEKEIAEKAPANLVEIKEAMARGEWPV